MDKAYMEIIQARLEYFSDKKVSDLSDEELNEFINLRKEVLSMIEPVFQRALKAFEETLAHAIDSLYDILKPYISAQSKYQEKILHPNKHKPPETLEFKTLNSKDIDDINESLNKCMEVIYGHGNNI